MSVNFFYNDQNGEPKGPVSLEDLVALARGGRVRLSSLVWPEGGEPASADTYPELAAVVSDRSIVGQGRLVGKLQGWALLLRFLMFLASLLTVVAAPKAGHEMYRYFASRVALPNGKWLYFDASVWSGMRIFVALSVVVLSPFVLLIVMVGGNPFGAHVDPAVLQARLTDIGPLALAVSLFLIALGYAAIRWFVGGLRSEDHALNVDFTGGFMAYLGWFLLIMVSTVTIIGWAWAISGWMQWLCRHVQGSHSFKFVGSGWNILWRSIRAYIGLVFVYAAPMAAVQVSGTDGLPPIARDLLAAVFVLTVMVWIGGGIISWLANWVVSEIIVTPREVDVPVS